MCNTSGGDETKFAENAAKMNKNGVSHQVLIRGPGVIAFNLLKLRKNRFPFWRQTLLRIVVSSKVKLSNFIVAFLVPMLFGKTLVLYFGLNYSEFPGQGYGIGLALSILFVIAIFGLFLWKYRHYEDI